MAKTQVTHTQPRTSEYGSLDNVKVTLADDGSALVLGIMLDKPPVSRSKSGTMDFLATTHGFSVLKGQGPKGADLYVSVTVGTKSADAAEIKLVAKLAKLQAELAEARATAKRDIATLEASVK